MKKCVLIIVFLFSIIVTAQNAKNVEDGIFKINAFL